MLNKGSTVIVYQYQFLAYTPEKKHNKASKYGLLSRTELSENKRRWWPINSHHLPQFAESLIGSPSHVMLSDYDLTIISLLETTKLTVSNHL